MVQYESVTEDMTRLGLLFWALCLHCKEKIPQWRICEVSIELIVYIDRISTTTASSYHLNLSGGWLGGMLKQEMACIKDYMCGC